MSEENRNAIGEETVLLRTRPSWRSFLVFYLGILICVGGPFLRENPPISPTMGIVAGVIFFLIILRRWSNVYTLTNHGFAVRGGLFARDTTAEVPWSEVSAIEVLQGLTLRLLGVGHLLIRSHLPDQGNIVMYGQIDPNGLKMRMDQLVTEAGGQVISKSDSHDESSSPEA